MPIQLLRQALIVFVACALATEALSAEALRFEDADAAYDRGLYEKALRIARPLAERGDPRAQYLLSLIHAGVHGMPIDRCMSTFWADKAARQGYAPAMNRMAWAYFSGLGVPRSNVLAYRWALAGRRAGSQTAAKNVEMFGSGLNDQQRQAIGASMPTWRPEAQKLVRIVRPPSDWLGRFLWRLRGQRFCDD
ncbi:MAG: tetratricopeptide repeat protein [Alphaproteobacteria bacterium]